MNRFVAILVMLLLLLQAVPLMAEALETQERHGSASGAAIDILLLIAGLLCFVMCTRVFSLLRGGELSPGWQMLSVSFLIFSLSQLLSLSIELDIVALHKNAVSILHALALFLIVFGVAKIKKSLT